MAAWNTASGTLAWRKDYSSTVDFSKLFTGTAASPLLDGGAVIVQVGSDVHGGRIAALDPQTGAERWTWTGKGPGYASPVVFAVAGAATRRIELHTGVAIAFARSPMTVANVGWDLASSFGGSRVTLGIGSQVRAHNERRFSVPWSPPAPRIISASRSCTVRTERGPPCGG